MLVVGPASLCQRLVAGLTPARGVLRRQTLSGWTCASSRQGHIALAVPSANNFSRGVPPQLICQATCRWTASSSSRPLSLSGESEVAAIGSRDNGRHKLVIAKAGAGGASRSSSPAAQSRVFQRFSGRDAALRVTWLGAGVNVALSFMKYAIGTLSGSSALIADAAHSLSDLLSDAVTLFVVDAARAQPDERHPYGRGRYEAVGSLSVAAVLIGSAGGVGWSSFSNLLGWSTGAIEVGLATSGYGAAAISACVVSLLAKEALYRVTVKVGQEVGSQTLIANAWHHRSDAFSSIAALVGVVGGLAGVPWLDPASGMLVAALVAKAGAEIGWEALQEVMEKTSVDDETRRAVEAAAAATAGVVKVDRLRARKMGPYSLVDLRAQVDPKISVSSAHNLVKHLRSQIQGLLPTVSEVFVHISPAVSVPEHDGGQGELMRPYVEVEAEVREALKPISEIHGISHILIHYVVDHGIQLKVDIVCDQNLTIVRACGIARKAQAELLKLPQVIAADVDLELEV